MCTEGRGMSTGPNIEITPTPGQYRQLCRDLETLRAAGAASNTAAIVEAVHGAVDNARTMDAQEMAGRRTNGPGPEPRR
jgi:hypothetical protein